MAKQLLGKEVTAALNEKIKSKRSRASGKRSKILPSASSVLVKTQVISPMKEEQQNAAKL